MTPYATIGQKLGHSYSGLIHRAFGKYDFELIEVAPEKAEEFMRHAPYKGITVTIPYKKLALAVADEASPAARAIGCANTLVRRPDGTLWADNTDAAGFAYMARAAGVDFRGAKVLILGSGGTSLTTRTVARQQGAGEIVIVSRTGEVNYGNLLERHADAEIIVNATPVGMYPHTEESPLATLEPFTRLRAVLDVVYNPMRTRLKLEAASRGLSCGDGLDMLVAQAKFCMDDFLGARQEESIIPQVAALIRRQTANIVLTGMPGCGKSAVAQAVARHLGRKCIDCDAVIAERAGMTIAEIFAREGESGFRAREEEVIAEFARQSSLVIATGGGAILSRRNRLNLTANGFVFLLQRDTMQLEIGAGRPLSTSREAVEKLAETRGPLYRACADCLIDNNRTIPEAVEQIIDYITP